MTLKVGINGFGRIGRNIYRAAHELKPDFEIVAVNDIGDARTFPHLLKHDTALAYPADQKLKALPRKGQRRARAAADNIIPTSTGANRAVAEVLPELAGKFAGISFRVPILYVSVVDLAVEVTKATTAQDINAAF